MGAIDDEQNEECAICLAQFTEEKEDYVVVLDCANQSSNDSASLIKTIADLN